MPKRHTDMHENVIIYVRREAEGRYATISALFHDWFWSHQGRLGRKKAIIAVSRKMLALRYLLLKTNSAYCYYSKTA